MAQTTKDLAQNLDADVQKVEKTVVADAKKVEGQLVQFIIDVFPYCKGDIVRLVPDEIKRVLAEAKARGLSKVYKLVKG